MGGPDRVKAFVDKHEFGKLAIYLDPKSAALHAFKLRGLPTSILIGKDGKVLGKVEGSADWDSDKIAAAIKRAPGSESTGVPASEMRARSSPA
jgi:hypothetical protein